MRVLAIVALIAALSGANASGASTKITTMKAQVTGPSVPSLKSMKQEMCWPWYAGCEDKAVAAYKDAQADYEAENGYSRTHSDEDAALSTVNFAAKHEQEVIAAMEARNQAAESIGERTQRAAEAHVAQVNSLSN